MRIPSLLLLLGACTGSTVATDAPDLACPQLVQDADSLDFGAALFGSPTTKAVYLSSPCPGVLGLDDPIVDGDDAFSASVSSIELDEGGTVLLEVTYDPQAGDYGSHAAAVRLTHDAGELFVSVVGGVDPDQDGDGLDARAVGGTDCDDLDAGVGAPTDEVDNLKDDDCDGLVDEDFVSVGDVRITELMLRPQAVRAEVGQWVELRNLSERRVHLGGWTLQADSGELSLPEPVVVEALGRVVLGLELDPESNGGIEVDGELTGPGAPLSIRDWSVGLSAGERVIDHVEASSTWPDPLGASVTLDATLVGETAAQTAQAWCEASTVLPSGDKATPGQENDWCPGIDHDGDGGSLADGDCDDTDPDVGWRFIELWDGKDNDCDDFVDDLSADYAFGGLAFGGGGSQLAGNLDLLVHDWNGDGYDDLVLSSGAYKNEVIVVQGADLWGAEEAPIASLIGGTVSSASAIRMVPGTVGDLDGDGDVDLGLALSDRSGLDLLSVFDAPPMAGQSWDMDDAIVSVEDSDGASFGFSAHAVLDVDMDGDGVPEAIVADASTGGGSVRVLDLAGQSGVVEPADVELRAWTGATGQNLGVWLSGGDADGDGYDELYISEGGPTSGGSASVWRVSGASELPAKGAISAAADLQLDGLTPKWGLAIGRTEQGDVDGDGSVDLLVGDPGGAALYGLYDVSAQVGRIDLTTSADLSITSPKSASGASFARVDYDGDGAMDLIVGGAGLSTIDRGVVFGLSAATLAGGSTSLDVTDADFTILSRGGRDYYAVQLKAGDFDGDGRKNGIVVAAPLAAEDSASCCDGALYLFEPNE